VLYYVSLSDNHTGAFVGGVYINAGDIETASQAAVDLSGVKTCLSCLASPVPAGGPAIPAIGRLLSKDDLAACGPLHLVEVSG
jgi:hypothetical protein